SDGTQIADFEYDAVDGLYNRFQHGDYIVVKKNQKAGVVDYEGKILIKPDFYHSLSLRDGLFFMGYNEEKGTVGLHDLFGNKLVAPEYEHIHTRGMKVKGGPLKGIQLFGVEKNEQMGWYHNEAAKLIKPAYTGIKLYSTPDSLQTYMLVEKQNGADLGQTIKGLVDLHGKELIPMVYEDIEFVTASLFKVRKEGKYGLFDIETSKEVLALDFEYISKAEDSE